MIDVIKKTWLTGIVFVLGGFLYFFHADQDPVIVVGELDLGNETQPLSRIPVMTVHFAGAVLHPGVYEIPVGMTLLEAVSYSGGFLNHANLDKVNLAKELRDGQRILVPFLKQKQQGVVRSHYKIDINRASRDDLLLIPGVGARIASYIIGYRQDHGFFKSYDDLLQVKYIGKGMLKKIKPYIILD